MEDWQTFGLIFENLCLRDLTVYARAHELARPIPVRYYRDDSGLEVDAIVELADGRWAAFEIKTSESKVAPAVANLKRLRKKLCESPRVQMKPPPSWPLSRGSASTFASSRRESTSSPSAH